MRLTIIPTDGVAILDKEVYRNLDLSFIDNTINAVQWYETHGEVEYKDPITGRMLENRPITDISEFSEVIELLNEAKATKVANSLNGNNQPTATGSQSF